MCIEIPEDLASLNPPSCIYLYLQPSNRSLPCQSSLHPP